MIIKILKLKLFAMILKWAEKFYIFLLSLILVRFVAYTHNEEMINFS